MYMLIPDNNGPKLVTLNHAEPYERVRNAGKLEQYTTITWFTKNHYNDGLLINERIIDFPFKQFMAYFEAAQRDGKTLDMTNEALDAFRKSLEPQPAQPKSVRNEFRT